MIIKILILTSFLALLSEATIRIPITKYVLKNDAIEEKIRGSPKVSLQQDVGILITANIKSVSVNLTIDSTSDDIWVMTANCTRNTTMNTKYQFCGCKQSFEYSYKKIRGATCNTTVQIGSREFKDVSVQFAIGTSYEFRSTFPASANGGIGLKNNQLSKLLRPQNLIALHLSSNASVSALYLGVPEKLTPFNTSGVQPDYIFSNSKKAWQFSLSHISNDISEDKTWCTYGCYALIDTKFNGISGPAKEINDLNAYIGVDEHGNIDCYKATIGEPLIFHIGSKRYKLDAKNYIVKSDDKFNYKCKSVFVPDYSYNGDWKLGLSFLQQYLTVFDVSSNAISFLPLYENL